MSLINVIGFAESSYMSEGRRKNAESLLSISRRRTPVVDAWPAKLIVEPTTSCSLSCPFCPVGAGLLRRPKGEMSYDGFTHVVGDLEEWLATISLWIFGEPFMNQAVYDMIAFAEARDISVICSTNGVPFQHRCSENIGRLLDSRLTQLIVAVDGGNAETHQMYRRGSSYESIIQGLGELLSTRNKRGLTRPLVEMQCVAMRHNEAELGELEQIAQSLGVDQFTVKTLNVDTVSALRERKLRNGQRTADCPAPSDFLPVDESLSRYASACSHRPMVSSCLVPWTMMLVTQDGEAIPCFRDADADFSFGNVFVDGARAVWNSEAAQDFRRSMTNEQDVPELCRGCHCGTRSIARTKSFGQAEGHFMDAQWLERVARQGTERRNG